MLFSIKVGVIPQLSVAEIFALHEGAFLLDFDTREFSVR